MDKVQNKFNRCEHPRTIINKYTGDPVYVECGECPYCLIKKSDIKRNLCDYEMFHKKYCFFVTLTYNSQYVPKMAATPLLDYMPDYKANICDSAVRSILLIRILQDPRCVQSADPLLEKMNQQYIQEHLKIIYLEREKALKYRPPVYGSDARPYILHTVPRMSRLHKFKDMYQEELIWMKPSVLEALKKKNKTEGNDNAFPQFKGLLKYVNYSDYQSFAKRLRKNLFTKIGKYEKISFYVVSEYSPRTFRPHFHILFFFDSDEVAKNLRQAVFKSWKYGRCDIQLSRGSSSSYVSGYVNSIVSLPYIYKRIKFTKNKSRFSKCFGYENFQKYVQTLSDPVDISIMRARYAQGKRIVDFYPPVSYINRLFPRFTSFGPNFLKENIECMRIIRRILQEFRRREPFQEETPSNVSRFIYERINYLYNYYGCNFDYLPEYFMQYLVLTRTRKEIFFWTDSLKAKLSMPLYRYRLVSSKGDNFISVFRNTERYLTVCANESLREQLSIQEQFFCKYDYSDEWLPLFYVNSGRNLINHPNFSICKESNYKEIHYFRIKHKVLNDENNLFCDD